MMRRDRVPDPKPEDIIALMQAFAAGEIIRFRSKQRGLRFGIFSTTSVTAPFWNFDDFDYRVVPKERAEKEPTFLWINARPVGWFSSQDGFHVGDPSAACVLSGVEVSTHEQPGWQKVQVIE